MISPSVARRYAAALYQAAAEQDTAAAIEEHFAAVVEGLQQEPKVRRFIENRRFSRAERQQLLLQLAGTEAPVLLQNFLRLVLDKQRENMLPGLYHEYHQTMLAAANIVEAEVVTAVDLSAGGLERIRERLDRITGQEVRVVARTDPDLVGGLVVRIGDRRLDGSFKRRLQELAQAMAGTGREQEGVAVP